MYYDEINGGLIPAFTYFFFEMTISKAYDRIFIFWKIGTQCRYCSMHIVEILQKVLIKTKLFCLSFLYGMFVDDTVKDRWRSLLLALRIDASND